MLSELCMDCCERSTAELQLVVSTLAETLQLGDELWERKHIEGTVTGNGGLGTNVTYLIEQGGNANSISGQA